MTCEPFTSICGLFRPPSLARRPRRSSVPESRVASNASGTLLHRDRYCLSCVFSSAFGSTVAGLSGLVISFSRSGVPSMRFSAG